MKIKELTAKDIKNIMMDKALIIVLVFMIIGIIIIEPSFLQIRVLTDILTQSAVKMICALGLMFALLLGGTDLSGGRQVGLAAVMVASLSQMADYSNKFWPGLPELPIIIPVIMTLALVAVIGAVNGFMIAKLKMAPFIATFGMSTIVYGINCLYFAKKPNNSQPIGGIRNDLTVLSSFKVFGQISFLVVIAVIAIVGVWFLLNKTVFGKNIYIVGGNPEAAKVSGINVSKVIITVFIIESMFVGLAGILEVARTGGAKCIYNRIIHKLEK